MGRAPESLLTPLSDDSLEIILSIGKYSPKYQVEGHITTWKLTPRRKMFRIKVCNQLLTLIWEFKVYWKSSSFFQMGHLKQNRLFISYWISNGPHTRSNYLRKLLLYVVQQGCSYTIPQLVQIIWNCSISSVARLPSNFSIAIIIILSRSTRYLTWISRSWKKTFSSKHNSRCFCRQFHVFN